MFGQVDPPTPPKKTNQKNKLKWRILTNKGRSDFVNPSFVGAESCWTKFWSGWPNHWPNVLTISGVPCKSIIVYSSFIKILELSYNNFLNHDKILPFCTQQCHWSCIPNWLKTHIENIMLTMYLTERLLLSLAFHASMKAC